MRLLVLFLFFIILLRFVKAKGMDATSKKILYCFLGIWFVALLIVVWNPFGFYPISVYTYFLVYLNVLSFVLGFSMLSTPKRLYKKFNVFKLETSIEVVLNSTVFKILMAITLLYTTALMVKNYQTVMLYQSLGELRVAYFEDPGKLYGTHYVILRDVLLNPLSIILTPIFAYSCYRKKVWNIVLTGLFLFEHASLSGGRFGYVRIIFGLIFVMYCVYKIKVSKKNVLPLSALVGFYVGILIFTTMLRSSSFDMTKGSTSGTREEITSQIGIYVGGPIAALNYAVENDYISVMGGYRYGICTFSSVDRLIQPIAKIFDPSRLPASNKFIGYKQENLIGIAPQAERYNALYTAILFFYLDFGLIGVLFIPFLIGIFIRYLIFNLYRYANLPSLVLACWFFMKMMYSIFDYDFISVFYIFYFVLFFIWCHAKSSTINVPVTTNKSF